MRLCFVLAACFFEFHSNNSTVTVWLHKTRDSTAWKPIHAQLDLSIRASDNLGTVIDIGSWHVLYDNAHKNSIVLGPFTLTFR